MTKQLRLSIPALMIGVCIICLAGGGGGLIRPATASAGGWAVGGSDANVGNPAGTSELSLNATGDMNITAGHLRSVSKDHVFEFENPGSFSRFLGYQMGTSTRTTIVVGDGAPTDPIQDIVPFAVEVPAGQTRDIAQFRRSGSVVLAIDSKGRIRSGGATLEIRAATTPPALLLTTADGRHWSLPFAPAP